MRGKKGKWLSVWTAAVVIGLCLLSIADALGGEAGRAPAMPTHWKVVADFQVPPVQVEALRGKLGAELTSVRNIIYEVNGQRVQLNVIATPDSEQAQKLMTTLRSIKSEQALLRKGLTVYEFVGQNDVLPLIAEGRRYLE